MEEKGHKASVAGLDSEILDYVREIVMLGEDDERQICSMVSDMLRDNPGFLVKYIEACK